MADWKQITARIRRARTSKDPAGQLTSLFEKTRDAMVAFELAKHFEASGQGPDALKWYAAAAERFRRADWKNKAQEAITRLGGAVSENLQPASVSSEIENASAVPILPAEPGLPADQNAAALESMMALSSEIQSASERTPATPEAQTGGGRRRRGRRGGRNRRREGAQGASGATRQTPSPPSHERPSARPAHEGPSEEAAVGRPRDLTAESAERLEPGLRGRFGDPGISSRLTLLEMQFRRLLTCPPVKLDHAEKAPAGPGVFVLTDDEMTSYYYVEACDTLRIAIAHLTRGAGGRRGNPSLKPKLAEHLGITEARVGKYLADHCVVRWLQLDEGAIYFAHYAIAVLRPILNE